MRDSKKMVGIVGLLILLANVAIFFWPTPARQDLRNLRKNHDILKQNFQEITAEVKTWNTNFQGGNLQYSVNTLLGDFHSGVNNVIVPNVNNSIAILNMTELSTPEVIALRDQYVKSLEAYRDGAEKMLAALKANDQELFDEAKALLEQSERDLQAYYDSYKAVAKKNNFIYFD